MYCTLIIAINMYCTLIIAINMYCTLTIAINTVKFGANKHQMPKNITTKVCRKVIPMNTYLTCRKLTPKFTMQQSL